MRQIEVAQSDELCTVSRNVPRRLNLGCGRKKLENAVNLDVAATAPDVVHDLASRPWPFEDDAFDEVFAFDVIEHLDDFLGTMEEIHRISAAGARVHITVPHYSSRNAFTDPTHRRFFGVASMDYLSVSHEFNFYSEARYKVNRSAIVFEPSLLNKVVWRIVSRFPELYERRFAWIWPAWFLSFELEVLK